MRRTQTIYKSNCDSPESSLTEPRVCDGGGAGRLRKTQSVCLAAPTVCLCLCFAAHCLSGPCLSFAAATDEYMENTVGPINQ